MPSGWRAAAAVSALLLTCSAPAAAQPGSMPARAADGQITVRAVRAPGEMRVDGRLDEQIYAATEAITSFVQQEPDEFQPATERPRPG